MCQVYSEGSAAQHMLTAAGTRHLLSGSCCMRGCVGDCLSRQKFLNLLHKSQSIIGPIEYQFRLVLCIKSGLITDEKTKHFSSICSVRRVGNSIGFAARRTCHESTAPARDFDTKIFALDAFVCRNNFVRRLSGAKLTKAECSWRWERGKFN